MNLTAQIIPFHFEEKPLRGFERDGDPWFVAADLCQLVEVINVSQAVDRLESDERGVCSIYTPSGYQDMLVVSEAGMYALILASRKPKARPLLRWVTREVLPAIRKTGVYGAPKLITRDDLKEIAALVGGRLDKHGLVLASHENVLIDHTKRIEVCEDKLNNIQPFRRYFSENVQKLAVEVILYEFRGCCPIYQHTRIVNSFGNKIREVYQLDHWDGNRANTDPRNAFACSQKANNEMKDPIVRENNKHFYLFFQARLQERIKQDRLAKGPSRRTGSGIVRQAGQGELF